MPSRELAAETDLATLSRGMPEAENGVRPHLAIVDPSRLRRDCLVLAMRGAGWRVTDMPATRDLLRRLACGEIFDAVLIGGAGGGTDEDEVARLAAAAEPMPILVAADGEQGRPVARLRSVGTLPANAGLRMLIATLARMRGGTAPSPDAGRPAEAAPPRPLTRRQREVLALISQGKSNRLIAASLALSEETVKVHVKQIIKRLKVANRTQAAVVAAGAGRPFAPAGLPPPADPP